MVNFTRHVAPAVQTSGLTEAVTPTAVNVSGQTVAVTLVEYGAYAQISKFYEKTSIDVGLKEQVEAMGVNMGESINISVDVKSSLNILENLKEWCILSLRLLTPISWQPEASNQF